jgi:AcrR family transcriptional regulator
MVRVSKEYDERLNELLDASQQLFFQKGYELTSISDIIEKVGVAKGTFYHYFDSKDDLLDKIVERWSKQTLGRVEELMKRDDLNALDKLNAFFISIRDYKVENLELMKMIMTVYYRDENLMMRYKMFQQSLKWLVPEFVKIIEQGVKEGCFDVADEKETAELILSMSTNLSETMVKLLLNADKIPENLDKIEKKLKVYERSIERVLGAPPGSVSVVERRVIDLFSKEINI